MYQLLVWNLLQPYTLLLFFIGLVLASFWLKRREAWRRLLILTVLFLVFVSLSTPAMSHLALGSLEWQYPPRNERPAGTEAIVVLASSIRPADGVRLRAEMDDDGYDRCLRVLDLYRQGEPCPIVVSGGRMDPDPSVPACAEVMGQFLKERLGIHASDIILEGDSRTTYENAVYCQQLLSDRGLHRVVLVTDSIHLYRAVRCFQKQGIDTAPAACRYRATRFRASVGDFLPSPSSFHSCQQASHEWLGVAWYWLQGRI